MTNIAEQVADLTYLVDSPISTPYPSGSLGMNGGMNGRQSSSAESPADGGGKKRKADDAEGGAEGSGNANGQNGQNATTNGAHTRAKRNRYISIAW
jgi:hypothetical protein